MSRNPTDMLDSPASGLCQLRGQALVSALLFLQPKSVALRICARSAKSFCLQITAAETKPSELLENVTVVRHVEFRR